MSRNCEVRITDFGLARQLISVQEKAEERQDGEGMTEVWELESESEREVMVFPIEQMMDEREVIFAVQLPGSTMTP